MDPTDGFNFDGDGDSDDFGVLNPKTRHPSTAAVREAPVEGDAIGPGGRVVRRVYRETVASPGVLAGKEGGEGGIRKGLGEEAQKILDQFCAPTSPNNNLAWQRALLLSLSIFTSFSLSKQRSLLSLSLLRSLTFPWNGSPFLCHGFGLCWGCTRAHVLIAASSFARLRPGRRLGGCKRQRRVRRV